MNEDKAATKNRIRTNWLEVLTELETERHDRVGKKQRLTWDYVRRLKIASDQLRLDTKPLAMEDRGASHDPLDGDEPLKSIKLRTAS